jgi:hypothetical protein
VEACLQDHQVFADHSVHELVFLVDAPRPHIAGPMFETLGLTAPVARIAHSVIDQHIDSRDEPPVVLLPPQVVLPASSV